MTNIEFIRQCRNEFFENFNIILFNNLSTTLIILFIKFLNLNLRLLFSNKALNSLKNTFYFKYWNINKPDGQPPVLICSLEHEIFVLFQI